MSQVQRDAYGDASEISSDIFGVLGRDNRNHRKKQKLILEHTHAERDDCVLEVGCGSGLHALQYDQKYRYTGVDISPSLLATAAQRITDGCLLQQDVTDLCFGTNFYDAVVGTAILHHLDNQREALQEWARVTTSGGSITLVEPNYYFPKDFLSAHLAREEQQKKRMTPHQLEATLQLVRDSGAAISWSIEPVVFTPPWPSALTSLYDHIDSIASRMPVIRRLSMLYLIQISVHE